MGLSLFSAAVLVVLAGCGAPAPVSSDASQLPVVIDTDADVSDVAAVAALLLDPRVDVRAVTVTDAGTGVTNCASGRAVIRYILEELGRDDVPFACGGADAGPDARPFPPEFRTAADTAWGFDIAPRAQTATPESAVELLTRVVADSPAPPTIVALGPWTNIDAAIRADSSLVDRIRGIHAMAGSVDAPGNVLVDGLTPEDRLEWNVAADPSAFVSVFGTPIPLSIVPLDATDDVPVQPSIIDRLAEPSAAGANLVYELFLRVPGRIGEFQQLWDELAAIALVDADVVTWEEMQLAVDGDGRMNRAEDGRSVRVAMAADPAATEDALVGALARGPKRTAPFAIRGEVTVTYDGEACLADVPEGLAAGLASLSFTNSSGEPAGVALVGVSESHSWAELEELLRTIDVESSDEPDWIAFSGEAFDETGTSGAVKTTMTFGPGIHGPVCTSGDWPKLTFLTGEPFEVGAP